jgi:hypothetical protein
VVTETFDATSRRSEVTSLNSDRSKNRPGDHDPLDLVGSLVDLGHLRVTHHPAATDRLRFVDDLGPAVADAQFVQESDRSELT